MSHPLFTNRAAVSGCKNLVFSVFFRCSCDLGVPAGPTRGAAWLFALCTSFSRRCSARIGEKKKQRKTLQLYLFIYSFILPLPPPPPPAAASTCPLEAPPPARTLPLLICQLCQHRRGGGGGGVQCGIDRGDNQCNSSYGGGGAASCLPRCRLEERRRLNSCILACKKKKKITSRNCANICRYATQIGLIWCSGDSWDQWREVRRQGGLEGTPQGRRSDWRC